MGPLDNLWPPVHVIQTHIHVQHECGWPSNQLSKQSILMYNSAEHQGSGLDPFFALNFFLFRKFKVTNTQVWWQLQSVAISDLHPVVDAKTTATGVFEVDEFKMHWGTTITKIFNVGVTDVLSERFWFRNFAGDKHIQKDLTNRAC